MTLNTCHLSIMKDHTGTMVSTITIRIMTDRMVELHLGMVTTGMHGDLITTAQAIGFTIRPSLTRNQTGIIVTLNLTAMDITTALFITARLVGTMDILICTLDYHTTAIHTDTIQVPMLTIITTPTGFNIVTLIQMRLLTILVVQVVQVEQEHQLLQVTLEPQAGPDRQVQLVQQEVLVQLAVVAVVVLYL